MWKRFIVFSRSNTPQSAFLLLLSILLHIHFFHWLSWKGSKLITFASPKDTLCYVSVLLGSVLHLCWSRVGILQHKATEAAAKLSDSGHFEYKLVKKETELIPGKSCNLIFRDFGCVYQRFSCCIFSVLFQNVPLVSFIGFWVWGRGMVLLLI